MADCGFIDREALIKVIKDSIRRGTSGATIEKTLVKIGLDEQEAKNAVKTAKDEIKKEKRL